MLKSCRARLVQWAKPLKTKDGRMRAPRPLLGPHRESKVPWTAVVIFGGLAYVGAKRQYDKFTYVSPQQRFLQKIEIVPFGVLGTQLSSAGSMLTVGIAPEKDVGTVIVDPAGLHHIHGVADGAGGAAGSIYKWLGLRGRFPEAVRLAIAGPCDAKLFAYDASKLKAQGGFVEPPTAAASSASSAASSPAASSTTPTAGRPWYLFWKKSESVPAPSGGAAASSSSSTTTTATPAAAASASDATTGRGDASLATALHEQQLRRVIHVVGPDFRLGQWTEREASVALARAYRNILHEFALSGADKLRVPPVSGGIFSGHLYNQMPMLTQEALAAGFDQLHKYDRETLLQNNKKIQLCVFMDREWDGYCRAFDYIQPPEKAQ
jgi:O-acetyl-ADP-ribose deacetylase (regulator of RNase III)